MRAKRERDPLRAARKRMDAEDNAAFLAHAVKCRAIALVLWQDCYDRLRASRGRAAMEAYKAWKALRPLMHFFASEGVLHMDCPRPVCKRAKRCACDSMRCVRHEVLTSAEEAKARTDYRDFLTFMQAPEGSNDSHDVIPGRRRSLRTRNPETSECLSGFRVRADARPGMTKLVARSG